MFPSILISPPICNNSSGSSIPIPILPSESIIILCVPAVTNFNSSLSEAAEFWADIKVSLSTSDTPPNEPQLVPSHPSKVLLVVLYLIAPIWSVLLSLPPCPDGITIESVESKITLVVPLPIVISFEVISVKRFKFLFVPAFIFPFICKSPSISSFSSGVKKIFPSSSISNLFVFLTYIWNTSSPAPRLVSVDIYVFLSIDFKPPSSCHKPGPWQTSILLYVVLYRIAPFTSVLVWLEPTGIIIWVFELNLVTQPTEPMVIVSEVISLNKLNSLSSPANNPCVIFKFPPATNVLLVPPIVMLLTVFISVNISLSSLISLIIFLLTCKSLFTIKVPEPFLPIKISLSATPFHKYLSTSSEEVIFPSISTSLLNITTQFEPPIVIVLFSTASNIFFALSTSHTRSPLNIIVPPGINLLPTPPIFISLVKIFVNIFLSSSSSDIISLLTCKLLLIITLPATPPIVIADVFTSVNIFFATSTLPEIIW